MLAKADRRNIAGNVRPGGKYLIFNNFQTAFHSGCSSLEILPLSRNCKQGCHQCHGAICEQGGGNEPPAAKKLRMNEVDTGGKHDYCGNSVSRGRKHPDLKYCQPPSGVRSCRLLRQFPPTPEESSCTGGSTNNIEGPQRFPHERQFTRIVDFSFLG